MRTLESELAKDSERGLRRLAWEEMKLIRIGHVGEVLQGGGGKLSTSGGDPGEARKVPGHG